MKFPYIIAALVALGLIAEGLRRHDRHVREDALIQREVDSLAAVVNETLDSNLVLKSSIARRDTQIAVLSGLKQQVVVRTRTLVDTLEVALPVELKPLLDSVVAGYEEALVKQESVILLQQETIDAQGAAIERLESDLRGAIALNERLLKRRRPSILGKVALVAVTVGACALVDGPC